MNSYSDKAVKKNSMCLTWSLLSISIHAFFQGGVLNLGVRLGDWGLMRLSSLPPLCLPSCSDGCCPIWSWCCPEAGHRWSYPIPPMMLLRQVFILARRGTPRKWVHFCLTRPLTRETLIRVLRDQQSVRNFWAETVAAKLVFWPWPMGKKYNLQRNISSLIHISPYP